MKRITLACLFMLCCFGWHGYTQCTTYSLPFTETFDDTDTPTCWMESGDNSWDFSQSAGYAASKVTDHTPGGGTDYAWMDGSDNGDGEVSTLTSPKVDVSTLTIPALEFYAFSNNTNDEAINILDVDFYDGANWANVVNVTTLLGTNWTHFLIDLRSFTISGDVQVRFTITGNDNGGSTFYNDILIDDVSFIEGPTCFPPSFLEASNIKPDGATLGWTDAGATKWDVEVVTAGTTPTGTPTDAGVTNPYNKTSLTASTEYEFYVRSDCGGGDLSAWSGPVLFKTACAVEQTPWFDDVENHEATTSFTESECWTMEADGSYDWNIDDSGSTPSSNTGPSGAYSGSTFFYVEASSGSTEDEAKLITPVIDVDTLATPALKFYYHMYGSDMGDLHVDVFDGTAWTDDVGLIQGEQQTDDTDPWLSEKVSLAGYSGEIQLRFRAEKTQSGFEGDISLDDISVEELLMGPTEIAVDSVTQTTAVVSWKELGNENKWEIEYGPVDFDHGSGTIVVDDDGVMNEKITGLNPGTEYDVYVRSIDSDGNPSAWVGTYFVTVCKELATYPFKETFEEDSPNRLCARNNLVTGETRWEYVETNQNGTITPKNGSLMAEFRSTGRGDASKLVLGPFDLTSLKSPQVTFYYANVAWSGEVDELRVYYKTKIDTTWTQIGQNYDTEQTSWTKVDLALPDPSGSYFVAFEGISHYGRGINVDEIVIEEASACTQPSSIVVAPKIVSADISWNAGGNETIWKIEYGIKGFTPGTGNIATDNDGTPGLTITGLKPDTEYDVYVTAICAETNISDQLGPKSFITKSLDLKDQVFESFTYYPNPVIDGQLSMEATQEVKQVVMYNLLGQVVLKTFPNSLKPTLELNNLRTGVYLMKVTISGSTQVFRIIKE